MIKAIKKRRSVRSYLSKEVDDRELEELIKAAQFAPNSHHNRSWEFIIVKDLKTKKELYKIVDSKFLVSAPVLIIPLIDKSKSLRPIQDLAVASENILLQAVDFGLGAVWKNVTQEKGKEIQKLLKIPSNLLLINIIPVGYPKVVKRPHDDKDFDPNKIHMDKW